MNPQHSARKSLGRHVSLLGNQQIEFLDHFRCKCFSSLSLDDTHFPPCLCRHTVVAITSTVGCCHKCHYFIDRRKEERSFYFLFFFRLRRRGRENESHSWWIDVAIKMSTVHGNSKHKISKTLSRIVEIKNVLFEQRIELKQDELNFILLNFLHDSFYCYILLECISVWWKDRRKIPAVIER